MCHNLEAIAFKFAFNTMHNFEGTNNVSKDRPKNSVEALQRLKKGNKRYSGDKCQYFGHDKGTRKKWTKTQKPFAIVLSCADSRVMPEIVFDCGVSDLFVVRVAGNIADQTSLASIEYAIAELEVGLIVVLGHESCGAVKAAMSIGNKSLGHNLDMLLAHLKPAVDGARGKTKEAKIASAVKRNVKLTVNDLESRSKVIEDANPLIVPAYYNLASGIVSFL